MIEPRSQASSSGNFPNYRQVPPPQQSHYDRSHPMFVNKPARNYTLLIESRMKLFDQLSLAGVFHRLGPKPVDTSSQFYQDDRVCSYHSNSVGHDSEDCINLKHKIT